VTNRLRRGKCGCITGICLALYLGVSCFGKVIFIEEPKITHTEKNVPVSELVVKKIIESDYDDNVFFAKPVSLVSDEAGGIYIYDYVLKTILKFDKNFKFERRFVQEGRGPGEISSMGSGFHKLYYTPKPTGKLFIRDNMNKKISIYSPKGKHIEDRRIGEIYRRPFQPVVDGEGNYYMTSVDGGIVDKYSPDMTKLHTYLDEKLNHKFVVYKPYFDHKRFTDYFTPSIENTFYDVVAGKRLIIYLSRPSTVFVFKEKSLERQFNILLESPIRVFRQRMEERREKLSKMGRRLTSRAKMFSSFIIDKDDEQHFYLTGINEEQRLRCYKFNFEGKLIEISMTKILYKCVIFEKRNNYFYGLSPSDGRIYIFKKEVPK